MTDARECGVCGRTRFKSQAGAILCAACDGGLIAGCEWTALTTE
jgi:uncharacterized Zn finger protein (UPF0148 family)